MRNGKILFHVKGIAATTEPVVINGKRIRLDVEGLREAAKQALDTPLLYEHRGRPIGKIVKAWVRGNKLYYRAAIFEPKDAWTKEGVARIKSGELKGISVTFSYSEEEARSSG